MPNQPPLVQAIYVLAPILLALLSWGSLRLAALIQAHVHNAYAQGALLRLNDAVGTVVGEIAQTEVADLKAKASDGKLTNKEAKELRDTAVAKVRGYLGKNGVTALSRVFDSDMIQKVIESKIEAAVAEGKK